MPKLTLPAAAGAIPVASPSRRAALARLVASPVVGAALPALAEDDDAEILALGAEIERLNEIANEIAEAQIDPQHVGFEAVFGVVHCISGPHGQRIELAEIEAFCASSRSE
jgi:hypothetical protein